jgi:Ca-activated chloride channel family protein
MRLASIIALGLVFVGLAAPGDARAIGLLLPTEQGVEPLMIRYHRVNVTVRERMAETRVEQTFRNHTDQTLEATYVFPVPEGATVSGFAMWVNGRRQAGELLDAGQARQIYEQIVARMQDPGLVEYMGGNLFRARVFPIAPRAEQRIEIRFTQTLGYHAGVVHYRYPLRTDGRAARTLEDMTISASIVSRTPIGVVYSPSHEVSVARPDDQHATVGFERGQQTLDRDFDLYYSVRDGEVGLSLLTHRGAGEDGYFLAMIAPRTEVTEREIAAKEVLFVFDTSGSMAGEKIERARSALDYMLQRLNPRDSFQVVRFSTDVELLFDGGGSVPASPANVAAARQFAARFVAAGGTAIDSALTEALRTRAPSGALPRMVVFLTDGMPTIGETDPRNIVTNVAGRSGDSQLFAFGVGDDVNTTFLDQLARSNRGVGDYFRDGAEMERRMSAFYDRIAYPVLTDLRLLVPGLRTYDVYPRDLGHLYRGEQLLVTGRYRGAGRSRVQLEGRPSHERSAHTFGFDVAFPATEAQNDFLPRLWATRKIGYLLDEIRLRGERPELRTEVVTLARQFGIVTPYTSYLVVEDDAVPPGIVGNRGGMPMPVTGAERPADEPASADFRGFEQSISRFDFADRQVDGSLARPGFNGGGQGRAAGAPPSSSPPPPTVAPSGGAGEGGRNVSRRLREMREAERADAGGSRQSRFVQGRAFNEVGSAWVDSRYRRAMRLVRVRYGSEAYFELLRARPELRSVLALGQRVTVALDGRRAVSIEPAGATVSAADMRRFLTQ